MEEKVCLIGITGALDVNTRQVDEKGTPLKDFSLYSTIAHGIENVSMVI